MNLSNSVYDKLKLLVTVILPATATAYLGLDLLWDLPKENEVVGTIAVVVTFLGLFLNRSAASYEGAGDLIVTTDQRDGEVYLQTDLNDHPSTFKNDKNVTLNIRRQDIPA